VVSLTKTFFIVTLLETLTYFIVSVTTFMCNNTVMYSMFFGSLILWMMFVLCEYMNMFTVLHQILYVLGYLAKN